MHALTTLTLALSLLLPVAGCDLDDEGLFDRTAEASRGDADADAHRGPPPPPPVVLVQLAVERGELHDDPTMADALAALHDGVEQHRAADEALRQALATAIADGTLGAESLATERAAIDEAARSEALTWIEALDTAHDLLDAQQRADVVDALHQAMPDPAAPGDRPPPPEAGGGQGSPPPDASGSAPGPEPRGPLGPLLGALELDQAQQEALRDALGEPSRPEPPAPLDLASFAGESFDASTLGLEDGHAQHVDQQITHLVDLMIVLVPLLDDDQRATLVERLVSPPEPEPHPA